MDDRPPVFSGTILHMRCQSPAGGGRSSLLTSTQSGSKTLRSCCASDVSVVLLHHDKNVIYTYLFNSFSDVFYSPLDVFCFVGLRVLFFLFADALKSRSWSRSRLSERFYQNLMVLINFSFLAQIRPPWSWFGRRSGRVWDVRWRWRVACCGRIRHACCVTSGGWAPGCCTPDILTRETRRNTPYAAWRERATASTPVMSSMRRGQAAVPSWSQVRLLSRFTRVFLSLTSSQWILGVFVDGHLWCWFLRYLVSELSLVHA